jgi:hypothetical protein
MRRLGFAALLLTFSAPTTGFAQKAPKAAHGVTTDQYSLVRRVSTALPKGDALVKGVTQIINGQREEGVHTLAGSSSIKATYSIEANQSVGTKLTPPRTVRPPEEGETINGKWVIQKTWKGREIYRELEPEVNNTGKLRWRTVKRASAPIPEGVTLPNRTMSVRSVNRVNNADTELESLDTTQMRTR